MSFNLTKLMILETSNEEMCKKKMAQEIRKP